MKTFSPRSSFHHAVVTSSGSRRSTSRANASAQRRTTGNSQRGSIRHAMWMPRLPGRLRPAGPADLGQHLAHERGDALPVREGRARLRVDVDAQLVRPVDVAAARGPGVEVDDGEVRRPRDLRDLGHAQLVGVSPRRERDARHLDPVRPLLGHALLVDLLALDAVREAAQLRRPLVAARGRSRRRPRGSTRTRSSFVCAAAGKSTLSGFVTLTTRSPTSSSTKGDAMGAW